MSVYFPVGENRLMSQDIKVKKLDPPHHLILNKLFLDRHRFPKDEFDLLRIVFVTVL